MTTTGVPPTTPGPTPSGQRSRLSIGTKLGAVMAIMIATLVTTAVVLYTDVRTVAGNYEQLLVSRTRTSAQDAQEIGVEFKLQVQEWKNVLLRGYVPEDLATYSAQFREQIARVRALADDLEAGAEDPVVRDEVARFRVEYEALNLAYEAALAPFAAGGGNDAQIADRAVRGLDRPIDERLRAIVDRSETVLAERIASENEAVAARQRVFLVAGLALLALVLVVLAFVVTRIVRPIRALTGSAYRIAHVALPEAIEGIRRSPLDAEVPSLPAVTVPTRDELHDLAAAVTTLQDRAVELAVEQHRAERESAEMLLNLGRRNQSLLKRTLGYITELESQERDSAVLDRLFRLDHVTTRVRRNAESMLVLAGATETRIWSRPIPLGDVVRAALSEIEDYVRVDVHYLEDAAIVGTAVADVVHLLAELLENAAHFSPPTTRVTVVGQRTADGYRLRIIDHGIGMTAAELAVANGLISGAGPGRARSNVLGLHVVGRLADRRGIEVVLEASAGRGITCTIGLPPGVLAQAEEETPGRRIRTRGTLETDEPPTDGVVTPVALERVPVRSPGANRPARVAAVAVPDRGPDDRPREDADLFAPAPAAAGDGRADGRTDGTDQDGGIPRRVRGAQLPDLGPAGDGAPAYAAPDPERSRGRLSALISGVETGRATGAPRNGSTDTP